jgi:2-desacetyl-2-hydroxyethyl bacteriochlorophyllide A dehydrogenase
MVTMRAAWLRAKEHIEIAQVETPEPGPGEIRVRMLACGLCGSDLHFYHMGPVSPQMTPGHEMFGQIDAVGDGVEGLQSGARVAIEPLSSCGRCELCLSGRDSICREMALFGLHKPGGFAEFVVVPAHRAFAVPEDLATDIATLTEPMAVVVHGLRRGGFASGQRVLTVGAGSIGLLTVVAARALGAGEVWITARHPHQAELARALGADRVIMESDADASALWQLGLESPIDLAVETVGGSAETLRDAGAAVKPGGTVSVLGVFMGPVSVEPVAALTKEITFAWSNCYARPRDEADFETAVRLVDSHRTTLAALTTHTVPLDEIARAFELADDKSSGAVKVSVRIS